MGEQVDHREFIHRLLTSDGRSSLQGEAAGEDRQPSQHCALLFAQEVETPIKGCSQRLLARQRHAGTAGEKLEAIVQMGTDLLDR